MGLQSQDCRVAEREAPSYPKADLPVGAHLQIEAVGAVPVAVDNVHLAVAVEVRQGHTSPVLVGVIHTWEERQEPSGQRPCGSRDTNLAGGSVMSNKGGGSLLSPPFGMGRHSCKSQNFSIGVGGGTAIQLQRNQNPVFRHHLPSRHIIFTQFWGSLGETRENSGALKLSQPPQYYHLDTLS